MDPNGTVNTGLATLQADAETVGSQPGATPQLMEKHAKSIVVEKAPRAHGTYADVYKGYWTSPWTGKDETVAVKILRFAGSTKGTEEEDRALDVISKRLGREVYIWQKLNNPRITPLLGYTRTARMIADSERPSIISPWREFGNLDKFIKNTPKLDKINLLIQAAEAVNVLHTFDPTPIAHLDIKPDNFLVNDDGEVELCDFGISRVLEDVPSGFTTGAGAGTLPYQAPEYLVHNTRSTAVDVYSFGGVMLKVLTGKVPFASVPQGRLVIEVSKGKKPNRRDYQFSLPQAVVNELWGLMNRCWSFNPTERPTMAIVIQELNRIAAMMEGQPA
ncbi:hypothetical protein M407DRAFT_246237 [Tulasnella calospora MUT 4182]|uniref:Protein kinase domain-containing protein n=1 Tax=Tulasnella calospora MUT 4182 TaxID=1051891 RepID=A0A0C3Q724_9AGAM|nr:hypothetical protein M407DRAFT_246237 [Tulasnella calospora MUT 4182]